MTPDEMRDLEMQFLLAVRAALLHTVRAGHGPAMCVSADLCPEGALLVCGPAVWERLQALHVEGRLLAEGVSEAAAAIERCRKP